MKYVILTRDEEIQSEAARAFQSDDEVIITDQVDVALDACQGAEMIFVDLIATLKEPHKIAIATLKEPHKIAGYEEFAMAKMGHPVAKSTPLVLISAPPDYELDSMVGYPGFVFGQFARPITFKHLRRASTWV